MNETTHDLGDAGATFGTGGLGSDYRYRLWRKVGPGDRRVLFVMLNPSTASHEQDDPTIRRCIGFARAWGFGWLDVGNLFAFRATDPRKLPKVPNPIGPNNDFHLTRMATLAETVIAGWGARGSMNGRDQHVRILLSAIGKRPEVLRLTGSGQPGHPLYLPATLTPQPWIVR